MKNLFKIFGLALCLMVLASGCVGAGGFADAIKNADTANKHIKGTFSGWNTHFDYESWPVARDTAPQKAVTISPEATLKVTPVEN